MPAILSVARRILLYATNRVKSAYPSYYIFFATNGRKTSVRLLPHKYIYVIYKYIIRTYFIRAMIYTREYVNVHIIIMHRLFAGQNTVS